MPVVWFWSDICLHPNCYVFIVGNFITTWSPSVAWSPPKSCMMSHRRVASTPLVSGRSMVQFLENLQIFFSLLKLGSFINRLIEICPGFDLETSTVKKTRRFNRHGYCTTHIAVHGKLISHWTLGCSAPINLILRWISFFLIHYNMSKHFDVLCNILLSTSSSNSNTFFSSKITVVIIFV